MKINWKYWGLVSLCGLSLAGSYTMGAVSYLASGTRKISDYAETKFNQSQEWASEKLEDLKKEFSNKNEKWQQEVNKSFENSAIKKESLRVKTVRRRNSGEWSDLIIA